MKFSPFDEKNTKIRYANYECDKDNNKDNELYLLNKVS